MEPQVARNEIQRHRRTVLTALGLPAASEAEVSALYGNLERLGTSYDAAYRAPGSGSRGDAVARRFSGPGVWGDIVGVISLDAEGSRILGLEIVEHNETPGLGGRITTDDFLSQFRGERIGPGGIAMVRRGPGDYDPENASVDGIAGATSTSRAFLRIVNREIAELRQLVKRRSPSLLEEL